MPPDPTPLTEEEIHRLAADAPIARSILSKLCSQLRPPAMSIPVRDDDEDEVLRRCLDALPALLAAARENAELREELSKALNDTTWQDHADAWRKRCVTLTAERDDALARVLEGHQAVMVHIREKNALRAELASSQVELSRSNVRYEQSHRRAEAMWRERDAALARVAELEKILTPPTPDPKWVRCPAECSEGWLTVYGYPAGKCSKCDGSGRPGWVKETPQ